jgi:hypothetical protein
MKISRAEPGTIVKQMAHTSDSTLFSEIIIESPKGGVLIMPFVFLNIMYDISEYDSITKKIRDVIDKSIELHPTNKNTTFLRMDIFFTVKEVQLVANLPNFITNCIIYPIAEYVTPNTNYGWSG